MGGAGAGNTCTKRHSLTRTGSARGVLGRSRGGSAVTVTHRFRRGGRYRGQSVAAAEAMAEAKVETSA